jgi:hypothetical protein
VAASFDGTRIATADNLAPTTPVDGEWTDLGGGACSLETDFFYEGSNSASEQVKASEGGTCFTTDTQTYNASGNNLNFILKGIVTTSGLLDTTRATGQKFEIGSGSTEGNGRPTHYHQYYTYYSATYPPKESWIIHVFDVQEIGYIDNHVGGSMDQTAIDYWGQAATMTGSVKSQNVATDALDYITQGQGLTWTGTGGTFQAFIDLDEGTTSNRWGVVTTREGVIYCLAVLSLSDTSATTFVDSNKKIIFPWTYVAEGAQGIDIDLSNSSTEVDLSVCSFTGNGTGAVKKWFDTTLDVDATSDYITIPSHGIETGDHILYSREGGSADIGPEPSNEGTLDWWAYVPDENHIGICSSRVNAYAGTVQALTSTGNENQSITKNPDNRIDFTYTGTNGTSVLDSCIIEGVRILTLTSAVDINGGFIQNIGNVVASTADLVGVKISEATLEEGVALLTPLAALTDTVDCEFVAAATVTSDAAARVWQVDATGPSYVDETTDFKDLGTADVSPFPAAEAAGDWFAVGYQRPFDRVVFNNAGGTAGVGVGLTVIWEYWNGSWTSLSGVSDGTSSFTATASDGQVLTYTLPTDWATTTINSSAELYYIRCRISAGSYSTNPVYDNGYIEGDNLQQHGHAVEITTAGEFNSNGNQFTGYWDPEIDGANLGWEFNTETGVNGTTEVITTNADHGFYSGDAVYYNNEGGSETPGPTNGNKYYVYVLTATTFKLHTTRSGAIADNSTTRVNLTASSSGNAETHSIYGSHAALFNDTTEQAADSWTTQDTAAQMYSGSTIGLGQSITGDGNELTSVVFKVRKVGSPTGNATVNLYAHSGTFGTSSVPTGASLAASETLDVSTLSTSYRDIKFNMTSFYTLVNATKYVITIEYSGGDVSNRIEVAFDVSPAGHGGNKCSSTGSWSPDANDDMYFYARTGGNVTVNATNGGDVPSYRNDTGAVTVATAAVTIEITGVTEGARCTIRRASDNSELLNALAYTSDGAGGFKASTGFAYTGDTNVYVSAAASGKVVAGVADDTGVFTDETIQANTSQTGSGDTMTLIPASSPASPDAFYFGHTEKFSQMDLDVLTAGTGTYTLAWEYWTGSGWSAVTGLSDGTNNYKNAGVNRVSWTEPGSWATTTVTNQPGTTALYYIRARFVSGSVTITPVGRTAQLDVTKYERWEDDSVIVSSGLSIKATWIEDTTAQF